jgi:hypothetical protein
LLSHLSEQVVLRAYLQQSEQVTNTVLHVRFQVLIAVTSSHGVLRTVHTSQWTLFKLMFIH